MGVFLLLWQKEFLIDIECISSWVDLLICWIVEISKYFIIFILILNWDSQQCRDSCLKINKYYVIFRKIDNSTRFQINQWWDTFDMNWQFFIFSYDRKRHQLQFQVKWQKYLYLKEVFLKKKWWFKDLGFLKMGSLIIISKMGSNMKNWLARLEMFLLK